MESGDTEETSTENAKISDSGYSNTCSNSQSHTSSGSSVSRNSNRSASSGYHGGNPSTIDTCPERLPKPITRRKAHKKKSKSSAVQAASADVAQGTIVANAVTIPVVVHSLNPIAEPIIDKSTEEVAVVELVDATDPGVHNDSNLESGPDAGHASKASLIDEISLKNTCYYGRTRSGKSASVTKNPQISDARRVQYTDYTMSECSYLITGEIMGHVRKTQRFNDTPEIRKEEHYTVISLDDGLVMSVSPSLYMSLGYAMDLWKGKLFLDFVDPRDKISFTERLSDEMALCGEYRSPGIERRNDIYCRLRMMDGQYKPYQIDPRVQDVQKDKLPITHSKFMLLVIFFRPVRSAYKEPEEKNLSKVFITRHNAACRFSYVDTDVVHYLGYMPQDMLDHSVFDFYYPEDLPLMKEIYETVITLESPTRLKPYRYIVQNGETIVLETVWSTFINPWTKSLEFVTGFHRVLKGPLNPNVYHSPKQNKDFFSNFGEEVLNETKVIESEIKALISEVAHKRAKCCAVNPASKLAASTTLEPSEITSIVDNMILDMKSPALIKDHLTGDDRSFSEHDSVMLGEISPHHEYYDSKSSTETPPSYNQLNYHDNIERFFKSNVGISLNSRPYGSDEENLNSSNNSSDQPKKNKTSRPELKCTSSTNGSGNSGSGENLSSESNNQQSFGSRGEISNTTSNSTNNGEFKPAHLTEILLSKHNEDMEKLMVLKHKEQKKGDKRNKSSINDQKNKTEQLNSCNKNGTKLKRNGSQYRDDHNNSKIPKYDDTTKIPTSISQIPVTSNTNFVSTHLDSTPNIVRTSPNQWPPISLPMPSTTTITHQCFSTPNASSQAMNRFPTFPPMFPVYYLPVPQSRDSLPLSAVSHEHSIFSNSVNQTAPVCYIPVPYMTTAVSSVIYPPLIGAPTPGPMMYRPFLVPETVPTPSSVNIVNQPTCLPVTALPTTTTTMTTSSSFDPKRPISRANSVKAEPGSTMAMSESSKKIFSPFGIVSSCVSNEGGCCSVIDEYIPNTKEPSNLEDKIESSRNSSFFSSSMNKSCDSSSITDQRNTVHSFDSKERINKQVCCKTFGLIRKEPPWIEGVKLTPELIYQYQVTPKSFNDVLKADLEFLKHSKQPNLVNEQLGQLFLDLDLEGFSSKLLLEEPNSNSPSDNSSDGSHSPSRMGAW